MGHQNLMVECTRNSTECTTLFGCLRRVKERIMVRAVNISSQRRRRRADRLARATELNPAVVHLQVVMSVGPRLRQSLRLAHVRAPRQPSPRDVQTPPSNEMWPQGDGAVDFAGSYSALFS